MPCKLGTRRDDVVPERQTMYESGMSGVAPRAQKALVFCAGMAACTAFGCATTQHRTVWLKHLGEANLPPASERDVAVYLSEDLLEFELEAEESILDWRFPEMGRSVARWFVADLRERFANVGRSDILPSEASERDDFPIIVDLRVEGVEWTGESGFDDTLKGTVRLSLTVYDSRGAEVLSREVEGVATSNPVTSANQAEGIAQLLSLAASNATRNAAAIVEGLRIDAASLPPSIPINDWKDLRSTAPHDAAALVAESPVSDGSLDIGSALVGQNGFKAGANGYLDFGLRAVHRSRSGPYAGALISLGIPSNNDFHPSALPDVGYGLNVIGGIEPDWKYLAPWAEAGLGFGALWGGGDRAVGPEGHWAIGLDFPYDNNGIRRALGLFASGKAVYDIGLTSGAHVPPDGWLYSLTLGVRIRISLPINQVAAPKSCAPTCAFYDR